MIINSRRLWFGWLLNLPLWLTMSSLYGQAPSRLVTLSGKVFDAQGQPLASATVTLADTTVGAITAVDGSFQLRAYPRRRYVFVVRYLGYQPYQEKLDLLSDTYKSVSLKEEALTTETVVIASDGRDPGYTILQKAIEKREYYRKQLPVYTYKAYTRTKIISLKRPEKIGPIRIRAKTEKPDTGAQILYLAENISNVAVAEPNDIRETVVATKVSGRSDSYSLFSSLFVRFSVWDPFVQLEGISARGFVSPLSDNALFYYTPKLKGSFQEDGRTIYKIALQARRSNDPVFEGSIYIVDSLFTVHSLDFTVDKSRQLDIIDTLRIRQTLAPVAPNAWKPLTTRFDFFGGPLGFQFTGYSLTSQSSYVPNPTLPKNYFKAEVLSVSDTAVGKDSAFWAANRPLSLEADEIKDYQTKDSLEAVRESPAYLDSLTRVRNRLRPSILYTEYTYYNYRTKHGWQFRPLYDWVGFNTMEGLYIDLSVARKWYIRKLERLIVAPTLRYGFANEQLYGQLRVTYNWEQRGRGGFGADERYIQLTVGDYIQVFGNDVQIVPVMNTFNTLLTRMNYQKLFRRQSIRLEGRRGIANGVDVRASIEYQNRLELPNVTDYSWTSTGTPAYSPNLAFTPHDVVLVEATFKILIANRYISTPEGRLNLGSKWPEVYVSWRQAVPVASAMSPSFGSVRASFKQEISLRLLGKFTWQLIGGSFLWSQRVQITDAFIWKSNQLFLQSPNRLDQFALHDYYTQPSTRAMVMLHAEHRFGGFFLKKLPLLKKLNWNEVVGFHGGWVPESGSYAEISAGIDKIFRLLRADFHTRILGSGNRQWGITFGVELPF
jgi:hypothetical protein